MRRVGAAVLVVVVLSLAGCGSLGGPGGDPGTPGGTPTSTELALPWGSERVVVAVDKPDRYANRTMRDELRTALDYWEAHPTWYRPEFVLRPNATDPDVIVRVRPRIRDCGSGPANASYEWCGPSLAPGERAPSPTRVSISGAYTDAATVEIAKGAVANLMGVADPLSHVRNGSSLQYRDPWPVSDPVVVGINDTVNDSRRFAGLVERAVDYWNRNDERYGNYTAQFVVRPNASDPDVEVRFVESIPSCGVEPPTDEFVGCANFLDRSRLAADTEVVRIVGGMTDRGTYRTLVHEFGHLHGVGHGEPPMPVMAKRFDPTMLSVADARNRSNPWDRSPIRYYVDLDGIADRRAVLDQVERAVTYYERGADGAVPKNVSFRRTRSRADADVVIAFPGELPGGGTGSDADVYGVDEDVDDRLEFYTNATVYVAGVETDRVGWHVGYWLGHALGLVDDEYPPPFDDPRTDPREEWWR